MPRKDTRAAEPADDTPPFAQRPDPPEMTRGQRFRRWLDFNHGVALTIAVAAGLMLMPLGIVSVPLVYPIVGLLSALSMAMQPTWLKLDNPRIDPVQADRVRRIVGELCADIGCQEPRVHIALTKSMNAMASSMFGRGRMVVFSGLLEKMDDREVKAVLAHEMGHVRQRHLAVLRILTLPLWFVDLDKIAGGALALLHVNAISGILMPMMVYGGLLTGINGVMRLAESSADRYSAKVTGDPLAMASALGKLRGKSAPEPTRDQIASLSPPKRVLYYTAIGLMRVLGVMVNNHPPIAKRIAAMERIAAAQGQTTATSRDAGGFGVAETQPAASECAGVETGSLQTPVRSLLGKVRRTPSRDVKAASMPRTPAIAQPAVPEPPAAAAPERGGLA